MLLPHVMLRARSVAGLERIPSVMGMDMSWTRRGSESWAGIRTFATIIFSAVIVVGAANAVDVCAGQAHCDTNLGPPAQVGSASLSGYSVHPATGNLYLLAVDAVSSPAVGAPLTLVRSYNSRGKRENVGFGRGWTDSFSWLVSEPEPDHARITRPDGRAIYFSRAASGWIADPGEFGTLKGSTAKGYSYVDKHGTRYAFDSLEHKGRLQSIQRAGDPVALTVEYADTGLHILAVRSGSGFGNAGAGAQLVFEWKGEFIVAVVDQSSNRWTYIYDTVRSLLVRVTKPHTDHDGTRAETEYSYEKVCTAHTCFAAGGGGPAVTRIRVRQSKDVWINAGFFDYRSAAGSSEPKVVRAALGDVDGVLQGLTLWRYDTTSGGVVTTQTLNSGKTQLRATSGFVGNAPLLRVVALEYMKPFRWRSDYVYNADATLASYTDFSGTRTTYSQYDKKGNPGHMAIAAGTTTELATDYTYHPLLSTPLSITRRSLDGKSRHTIVFDYDADTDSAYNTAPTVNLHRIIETGKTDLHSSGSLADTQTATTTFSYDALNRLISVELSNGMEARYGYFGANADPNNQYRLRSTSLQGANGKKLEWTEDSYDANGRRLVSTDPNLTRAIRTFNAIGLVSSRSFRKGNSAKSESYEYDANGATTSVMASPGGERTTYEYDAGARLRRRVDFGPDRSLMRSEVYGYDPQNGKLVVVRRLSATGATGGETCTPAEGLSDCTQFGYDGLGRMTSVRTLGSDNRPCTACEASYEFDAAGYVVARHEGGVLTRTYARDAFGRVTQITFPGGGKETLAYDSNDHLILRRDARDSTNGGSGGDRSQRYIYDDFGHLVTVNGPNTGRLAATYDAYGFMTAASEVPGGHTVEYTRDVAGRVVAVRGQDLTVSYSYDGSGDDAQGDNSLSRLSEIESVASDGTRSALRFAYDYLGRVVRQNEERGSGDQVARTSISYVRDAQERLAAIVYPDATRVAFEYANGAQPRTHYPLSVSVSFNDHPVQLLSNIRYAADGGIASLTYGDGRKLSITRNVRGEVTRIASGRESEAVFDAEYGYDPTGLGRVTEVRYFPKRPNEYRWALRYDALGRVTSYETNVTGKANTQYKYDEVGNRVIEQNATGRTVYRYAKQGDQLLALEGARNESWAYDENGYVIRHSIGGASQYAYTYDLFRRLRSIAQAGKCVDATGRSIECPVAQTSAVAYQYDAFGRQIERRDNAGNVTAYHYDASGALLSEEQSSGKKEGNGAVVYLTHHVSIARTELARIVRRCVVDSVTKQRNCRDQDILYVHPDLFGRPAAIVSARLDRLAWAGNFDAFGQWQSLGGLPGADGKIGTGDDLKFDVGNTQIDLNTDWESTDSFMKSIGRGSVWSRPSIGDQLGGPSEGQDLVAGLTAYGRDALDSQLSLRLQVGRSEQGPDTPFGPKMGLYAGEDGGTDGGTTDGGTKAPSDAPTKDPTTTLTTSPTVLDSNPATDTKAPTTPDAGTPMEKIFNTAKGNIPVEAQEVKPSPGSGPKETPTQTKGGIQRTIHFYCADDPCGTSVPKTWDPSMGEPKIPGGGLKDPPPPGVGGDTPVPGGGPAAILQSDSISTDTAVGGSKESTILSAGAKKCPKGSPCDTSPFELRDPDYMDPANSGTLPDSFSNPCLNGPGGGIAQCRPPDMP